MSTYLPHINRGTLPEYLKKAQVNLYVAATRIEDAGTQVLDVVNGAAATDDLGTVDLCRQRLLVVHGEAARAVDLADTLIARAWDILCVAIGTYNEMACALIDRTATRAACAPANDTGMQMYEGVVIMRLAQIVSELVDPLQMCLDVPHLPDSYEIECLPWTQLRDELARLAQTYVHHASVLRDTGNALLVLTHAA